MTNITVKVRRLKACERIFVFLALLGFSLRATAQNDYIKVTVETPGTLMEKVMDVEGSRITSLAIEGALNSADLDFLGNGTGKILTVRNLDLSNVTLAADEGAYKIYTMSDYFGEVMGSKIVKFYLSDTPRVETDTQDIGAIGGMNIIVTIYGNNLAGLFAGNTTLEKVIMPSFITEIGTATFYECTSINEVGIPEQVTEIADRAFYHAEKLSSILFPEKLTSIGELAFEKSALTSVILPPSVESVGDHAFFNVTTLRQVDLSGVSYIGESSFERCNIEGSLDLSNAIEIGAKAFSGNNEINELKFSGRLRSIGDMAFNRIPSLTGLDLPEGLESIGSEAFAFCQNLASVTIPSTLNDIGYRAFFDTPWEDGLKGENGVLYLGDIAYKYDCTSVTDEKVLTFKEGTKVIGSSFNLDEYTRNGYYPCDVIGEVNFPSTLKRINGSCPLYNTTFRIKSKCDIQFPEGLEYIGDHAFQYSEISFEAIPESVTYIGNYAFDGCKNIPDVSLGTSSDSIYIGNYAFRGCDNISEVNLGPSIKHLGEGCFDYCTALSEISYNCNPDSVGGSAFGGTTPYRVKISPEVVLLKEYTFYGCGMTKLIFESIENRTKLLSIEPWCFGSHNLVSVTLPPMDYFSGFDCSNLKEIIVEGDCNIIDNPVGISDAIESIIIKGKVGKICDRAFGHSSYLNGSVVASPRGSGLKHFSAQQCDTIGHQAFYLNRQLESVDIPGGIKHVGVDAFYECKTLAEFPFRAEMSFEKGSFECTALSEVVIGDWCKSIPERAFCRCESLKTVTIAPTVTNVEDYAFENCFMLNDFNFKNIKSIGKEAFCNSVLTKVELPDGFSELGESAFYLAPVKEISLPASLKNIPRRAFMGTMGGKINWRVDDESGKVECCVIDTLAFANYIGNEEFCVPEGIEEIKDLAFRTGKFKTISLPSTLNSLQASAFYLCNDLQSIYCHAVEPPYVTAAYDFIPGHILTTFTGTVYVPAESVAKYRYSDFWGHFNIEPISVVIESIKLNHSELTLKPGDVLRLEAEILPVNATNQELSWSSTDEHVVTAGEYGWIAAQNPGTAEIIVTTTDGSGVSASCRITVESPAPQPVLIENIRLNYPEVTMLPGDVLQLEAEISPADATNQHLNWYSSNEDVVLVDETGRIAALTPGTAEVIAVTTDGSGLHASCFVKVDEINGIDMAESSVLKVTVDGHDLIVESDSDIVVINMSGFAVYEGPAARIRSLQSGIYFVKSDSRVCKVAVK